MQMKRKNTFRIGFLCIALIVAVALMAGCTKDSDKNKVFTAETVIETDGETLGTGTLSFPLTVVDGDGKEIHAEIHTEKKTVGEALEELGIIAGEESPTGIYVKVVNGITADYDEDGTYWAFYINDDYAQTGVNATQITEGDSYAFKVEQG